MPHGERGKVVEVKVFTREDNADLTAGVDMMVRVSVAQSGRLQPAIKWPADMEIKGLSRGLSLLKTCLT